MRALFFLFSLLLSTALLADEASPEKKLTRKRCSSCHTVPRPGKLSEAELNDSITEHGRKLRRLTEEEKTAIITYLRK